MQRSHGRSRIELAAERASGAIADAPDAISENEVMAHDEHEQARLDRPGGVSYLHIPAADPPRAAAFYAEVFGWEIRDPQSASPAFRDGSGHVIGHFVSDQEVAGDAGVRPYVYVQDVSSAVQRVRAAGGEIVREPFAEGDLTVALLRDPAGNVLGIWQFGAPA